MRTQVIDAIKGSNLQVLRLSTELPFDESGVPVYVRNPKTIFVGATEYSVDPFLQTLDGLNFSNSITSVTVYFTTDAKTIQPWYDTNMVMLTGLANTIESPGSTSRDFVVSTDYVNDLLVTEIEYRITKLT